MSPAFSRRPRCGRRAWRRCRRAVVGPRTTAEACAATPSISRSRSRTLALRPAASSAWRTIAWREGTANGCPRALPACVCGRRIATTSSPSRAPKEWLLIEWPEGEDEPTKYWLSTLPRRHRLPTLWSTSPNCAGASSATIRSSSRSSGSAISKGADGAASTITPRSASPPTAS